MSLQIVRKKLTPDEIAPANLRWNEDCDCVQQSPDGGTTWVDAPASDPRSADGFRLPPNASSEPRCNAAANMIAYLRKCIAVDLIATTNWSLASALLETLLLVFPGGVLVDLLLIVANVILTVGSSAITSAFTEGVYDDLLCVFYCNIDDDGQMDDAQLSAIYDAVAAGFDGTVQTVFGAHSSAIGAVGWSNAGVVGTEIGDCSACDCVEPPALQIQVIGITPYGTGLIEVSTGIWQVTAVDPGSGDYWALLETVDPGRKFICTASEIISGSGGFPQYRDYPSRSEGDYVQAVNIGVPNINGIGQSQPGGAGFVIQYTIASS